MKKIIIVFILLFASLISKAQQDTIITNKDTIFCRITKVSTMNIFFTQKGIGKSISLNDAVYYSKPQTPIEKTEAKILPQKDILIQDELIYMRKCLYKCHKEFKNGLLIWGGGTLVTMIGLINKESTGIVYFGSAVSFIGGVLMIDSHKWIGRAGVGLGGNGVLINYTF